MTRPAAETLMPVMFSPRPRGALVMSDHAKRHTTVQLRCGDQARHLLAFAARTQHGLWITWRDGGMQVSRRAGVRRRDGTGAGGWACSWHVDVRADNVYDPCGNLRTVLLHDFGASSGEIILRIR